MFCVFKPLFISVLLFNAVHSEKATEVTYVAAVLEYEPYNTWDDELQGVGVLIENAKAILRYANLSKEQSADIFVAPEYGIQSLDMHDDDTAKFLTYTQYVPDPSYEMSPCDMDTGSYMDAMKMLSCGAAELEMYLVVDLAELTPCSQFFETDAPWSIEWSPDCPSTGFFAYNTQVVFNRSGVVVAKYRKINLFLEPYFKPGPKDDSGAVFITDFDVAFSLQICFDIAFKDPGYNNVKHSGITDVVMSTAWVDELPFYLADTIQNGWSRGLRTNLLVSGYHKPAKSKLGSGIFKGYSNEQPVYTYNKDSGNVLLVTEVTTKATTASLNHISLKKSEVKHSMFEEGASPSIARPSKYTKESEQNVHVILHEDLSEYASVILESGLEGEVFEAHACSYDYFCCHLHYEYTGNLTYMLLAHSGRMTVGFGAYSIGSQVCGIVWCRNSEKSSCAMVELGIPSSDFFGPFNLTSPSFVADQVYPGGLKTDLTLISNDELQYSAMDSIYIISSDVAIADPLAVALFGRWYSNDP